MPNWKSRSDTEAWWSNQPGNRGKTYPSDDIAEKQYQRNKAAGEYNLSLLKSFFSRPSPKSRVDLGPSDQSTENYPRDVEGNIDLRKTGGKIKKYAKGGKISLKECKVNTADKGKNKSHW